MKTMKKHENMVIMVDQNIGISMKHGFSSAKTTATLFWFVFLETPLTKEDGGFTLISNN
jgi:hypothetical protein